MPHPFRSLEQGHWFKLICGASFHHVPAIRSLALAYTLAGADCIDVAADPAIINAARAGIRAAQDLIEPIQNSHFNAQPSPWLMVSLNDGEDPHFRKAEFNPALCPEHCDRPCEKVCPAEAIAFDPNGFSGVIDQRCYGCGRCLPICPIQHIVPRSYVSTPAAIAPLVLSGVEAVEIHTQVGRLPEFSRLWQAIAPWMHQLKLISISCPEGQGLIEYLWDLYKLISPLPCPVIWQTDGRPMSGDIGDGATRAAIKLGQKVLEAGLPGYVQLAGGTNSHTVAKLKALGLLRQNSMDSEKTLVPTSSSSEMASPWENVTVSGENLSASQSVSVRSSLPLQLPSRYIAGIAYGSFARVLLAPVLNQLEPSRVDDAPAIVPSESGIYRDRPTAVIPLTAAPPLPVPLETIPHLLWQAVHLADSLVSQLKPSIFANGNLAQTFSTNEHIHDHLSSSQTG